MDGRLQSCMFDPDSALKEQNGDHLRIFLAVSLCSTDLENREDSQITTR